MREIEDYDYKAQEIKDLQFQLNLAKQERDKALAGLQELTKQLKLFEETFSELKENPKFKESTAHEFYKKETQELNKALSELAELTQEKSCERCEHSKDIAAHLNIVICTYDDDDMPSEDGTTSLKVGKNFYCKYYTPKET